MEKSIITIRNSVIAGLILALIVWLVGFLPAAWAMLKQAGVWIWGILRLDVPLSLWFLGLLVVLVIASSVHLYKRMNRLRTQSTSGGSVAPVAAEQDVAPMPAPAQEQPELSELELRVLDCLARADGQPLELESITHRITNNNLRTEQALRRLEQRGLIDSAEGYMDPMVYYLTEAGQDKVIELGMV